ncbi:hypothetical protein OH76DRAFT_1413983 [Lentinus brumalis]|uniref:F-box domain-containing protein n=1 Tax=Lentinus brumalis TaxID=2498619 RepID=A0A371DV02_9APHY|nr:hypothetical protein OH76DRAFT_1413983 [Polyporus brumalis]
MSAASTTLCLPAELWDRVIDCLHDDKDALMRTSLVCKAWTPSSHFHLFHTMRFHEVPFALQFIATVPHLVASVRSFNLSSTAPSTVLDLCTVLDAMPNLTRLRITSCCPSGLPPPCYRARPIRRLQFANCPGLSDELFDILGLFTSIEHLHFYMAGGPVSSQTQPMLCRPVIRKLSSSRTSLDRILDVICRTSAVGNMETLSLDQGVGTWYEVNQVAEVLDTLRSTLLHLELAPDIAKYLSETPGLLWKTMNLSQCEALESLNLSSYSYANIRVTLQVYLAAVQAAPPGLRTLYIHLHSLPPRSRWYDMDEPLSACWNDLDTMLLTHGRRDLAVTVQLRGKSASVEILRTFIAGRLPGAVKQGRLLVVETVLPGE